MRMGIGLGIGINRSNYAQGIFSAYQSRVVADGGITEGGACVNAVSSLLQSASLLLIPSGYKGGKAYAEIPTNGNGDLTWTRASTALRTNSSGLLESMGSGVPRLSYMYGSCPALLLEPQRTNLALYSEDFTNGWSLEGLTVSSNTTTAPDGNTTADRVTESAITDVHRIYRSAYTITSGTTYTYSLFVLKGTSRYCRLVFNQSSSASIWAAAQFDLDTLTFTSGVGSGGGTFSGATISQLPNSSWIRITISASLATTSAFAFFALSNGTAISSSDSRGCNSYLGSTSNNLIIWGAQLELGAYATTIIPTTTASATRVADSFSRNNIYTNGLISASGGTWFVELRGNVAYTRDAFGAGLYISDTTNISSNNINIRNGGTSRLAINKVIAGVSTALYLTTTDTTKLAIKWNGTSADIFANGTKVISATAFTPTAMQFLSCDATDVPKFIQQMALYPSPLSDTDCTTLTTL